MPIYEGNSKIGTIYNGTNRLTKVYVGNTQVFGYKPNEVVLETSTPQTNTINIKVSGYFQIIVVAGGGGGAAGADQAKYAGKSRASSGGSGSYVNAVYYLQKGTYSYTVGGGGGGSGTGMWTLNTGGTGGSSSFSDKIVCGGGTGGAAIWTDRSGTHEGYGGTVTTLTGASTVNASVNGNNGTVWGGYSGWVTPGASVYGGYGVGGSAYCDSGGGGTSAGGNGYIKIVAL